MKEHATNEKQEKQPIRFGLVHLLYATAQFAVCIALFGLAGALCAVSILLIWFQTLARPGNRMALLDFLVCLVVILFLAGILLPPVLSGHPVSKRVICNNHLKQIGLALHNYNIEHGEFPPASIDDEQGRPLHSWRVLILPYLEETALYQKYRFDEPWNGPNNSKLSANIPAAYRCPALENSSRISRESTPYVAVSGLETIWRKPRKNGPNLALLEAPELSVAWMSPHEPSVNQLFSTLTNPRFSSQSEGHTVSGRGALFSDGSVHAVPFQLQEETAAQLLTGTLTSDSDLWPAAVAYSSRWQNEGVWAVSLLVRFLVFLLVSFFPLVWLRSRNSV